MEPLTSLKRANLRKMWGRFLILSLPEDLTTSQAPKQLAFLHRRNPKKLQIPFTNVKSELISNLGLVISVMNMHTFSCSKHRGQDKIFFLMFGLFFISLKTSV